MVDDKDRLALINLIRWYRDKYHRRDFGHTEYIEILQDPNLTHKQYIMIEDIVDDWID